MSPTQQREIGGCRVPAFPPTPTPAQVFPECPRRVHCEELKDPEVWNHHPARADTALRFQADGPSSPAGTRILEGPEGVVAAQGHCVKKLDPTGKKLLSV